ncbi:PAF acetylhydrolase family protein [Aspergillus neoniger CBS 115656]|uniref:1-alkyl-2-acetylglycerophosphocholine esterase n=1 Tax=Aspergillus neoniger (strain CBS 115656) TaxID=1448310 RepID=A0A318Y813_ASPNB|nr:PAF acetylhydrolase family protein [Aspergillus neoniger CBS 115656]PYH28810.1 PAF acetylhydrolase family protein [Aspergillus neoniger CBS 115656]
MISAILCTSLLLLGLGQAATVPLPPSTGPCDVTLKASELVDWSRTNPFDPKGGKRALMVTTFTPVNCGSVLSGSYIPNATAAYEDETFQSFGLPAGTFESLRIQTQQQLLSSSNNESYPLVLFSPALGVHGFAVISVDHPYDADIVEFPDGGTVIGILENTTTDAQFTWAMNVRVQDMIFVYNQTRNETAVRDIFPLSLENPDLLALDRVSITGHSLGGATAAQTMLVDNRFVGGINLDGSFWGSILKKGLSSPFLMFSNANHTAKTDPSWGTFWSNLRGWRLELRLAQSKHYSFSDLPVLVESLSISDELKEIAQETYLGTIGALRAKNVVVSYMVAALQYFTSGRTSDLLSGPCAAYPDVTFVHSA